MDLGLDYSDADYIDCLEALIQAQLQLRRSCSGHQLSGGVAGGGYLLGLIAFARKFMRVFLSLSLLCGILFVSFYLGDTYDENQADSTSLATLNAGVAEGNQRQPCYL
ncbi:Hypothetical predicted protein [Drosophila guanche]|nr:Hypothetical predicted protein [Drosophila guanche]